MSTDGDGFSHLQGENKQHEMILTMPKNGNGLFNVRCKCMAEYRNVSSRYVNYDYIAQVNNGEQAVQVYRFHLETGAKLVRF